jgi:hypothetical protein
MPSAVLEHDPPNRTDLEIGTRVANWLQTRTPSIKLVFKFSKKPSRRMAELADAADSKSHKHLRLSFYLAEKHKLIDIFQKVL